MATNDRIRVSDADRERVTTKLRDHFAAGRLNREELDERITAALNAKTVGDLRQVMTDLPGDGTERAGLAPAGGLTWATRPGPVYRRRGPRVLPVALLVLLAAVLLPAGPWLLFAIFPLFLMFMLVAGATALFAAARFRRRMWRHGQIGPGYYYHQSWSRPGL